VGLFSFRELFAGQYRPIIKGRPTVLAQNHIRSYAMYIGTLLRAFAQWRRHRIAIRELSGLDDRALSDIGLNRTMVRRAVYTGRSR
jgi:uncharacterized protein YjiS (DUF1127 family)